MELKMMIQGKLVDRVALPAERCRDNSYLEGLRENLKAKHKEEVACNNQRVTFYIEVKSER